MIKITSLELENVKRVKALRIQPTETGLTVLGGLNAQGKTSVLDAICYALGGERKRPSNLQREGGLAPARIELTMSNGLVVTRSGKNAALKVMDPDGSKGGQGLLNAFIDELSLDIPKFLGMTGIEKAKILLRILGIGDQLERLDKEERTVYQERESFGRIADQKLKYWQEMVSFADVPDEPISAADLVKQSQGIMQRNAEKQNYRLLIEKMVAEANTAKEIHERKKARVAELEKMLETAEEEAKGAFVAANAAALRAAADRDTIDEDESTDEIQSAIENMEETNRKIRANMDKERAKEDADEHGERYKLLSTQVEEVRDRRKALLDGAEMPLPGLSVQAGELTYNGKAWDCMSGAEQIRASVAIVRKLKPECGFILLDKLESLDNTQLAELGAWLEAEGLQAIATRVSTGAECSIIIEDGMIQGTDMPEATNPEPETKTEEDW